MGINKRHNDIIEESQEDLNDDEQDYSRPRPFKEESKHLSHHGQDPEEEEKNDEDDINSLDEENLSVGLGMGIRQVKH
jgi:hypothetical protein